MKFDCKAN